MVINARLADLPDYPFERLRELLDPLAPGTGGAPIAMSLGEPQHGYPDFVGRILAENDHLYGKYPPVRGTDGFREAVRDWLEMRYRLPAGMIARDRHIAPCAGTRESLFMIAFAVVPVEKAGARPAVVMPNPFYQCYAGAALASGAEPVYLAAGAKSGFLPDLDALDEELLARTALFYLCSPSNPQGAVADAGYLETLVGLARRHDFTLVVDECYAEIHRGQAPPGVLQACATLGGGLDNVLAFHSLSKRSSVPGLRSGFLAGDQRLVALLLRLKEYGGNPSPLPVDAAATALWREESHVAENRRLYDEKFDLAAQILGEDYGNCRPAGGFFLWLDVDDGEAMATRLWREAAVRVLPGAYLTAPGPGAREAGGRYVRVALVHDLATTREALERLAPVLADGV